MNPPLCDSRVVAFLGPAGSGKTEVAINLALLWARFFDDVAIVDFDYVTPYFRSQDVRWRLAECGVRVVASPPKYHDFDVPVVPAELPQVVLNERLRIIFDVGGDEMGSRMLGQLRPQLEAVSAAPYVVVNTRRPQTPNAGAIVEAVREIEAACGLAVAGLVANSNVGHETDRAVCREGIEATMQASGVLGVPVVLVACLAGLEKGLLAPEGVAVLPVHPQLALPWSGDRPAR